jgi:hypothetical protein
MRIVQAYLSFTIVLYFFGPLAWNTKDPALLCAYLLLVQVALYAGFRTAIQRFRREEAPLKEWELPGWEPSQRLANVLPGMIVVSTLFAALNATRYLGLTSLSLQSLIFSAQQGLSNPFTQYEVSLQGGEFGGSLLPFMSTLLAPVLWSTIPLSLLYFRSLKKISKALAVLLITLEAVRWIGMGTNKGIFDLVIICCVVIFIRRTQDFLGGNGKPKKGKIKYLRSVLLVLALVAGGIGYFSNAIGGRVNLDGGSREVWANFTASLGGVDINQSSFLMSLCPTFLRSTLVFLTSYLTQGYFALSLALPMPWTPMFGIGNSNFLMQKIGPIANVQFLQYTYQAKLQSLGWDPAVNWHTAYVWLANDVSFIGVIPLMFLLGYGVAEAVKDAVILRDPISAVVLCLMAVMLLYLPANNQVLSFPSTFMAFWVCGAVWVTQRSRRRKTERSRGSIS